jgi:hypothetical protein
MVMAYREDILSSRFPIRRGRRFAGIDGLSGGRARSKKAGKHIFIP